VSGVGLVDASTWIGSDGGPVMIGRRIESRAAISWAALLGLALAVGLAVVGLIRGQRDWAIGAILPAAIGLGLLAARDRPFAARFGAEALEVEDPAATIPYDSITMVWAGGRRPDPEQTGRRSFPIQVAHTAGILKVPARLDVESAEVYRFFADRFPPSGGRDINPALAEFLEQESSIFGHDRVWTYRAARQRAPRPGYRRLRAVLLSVALAGLAWIIIGAQDPERSPWLPFGIVAVVIGLVLLACSFASGLEMGPQGLKGWRQASLVISPGGLGMIQGDIQGIIRWDELRNVRLQARPRVFRASSAAPALPGILLIVEGASILIADIYDRPLHVIFERLNACRSGAEADSPPLG
jgi:hypothetical protein